MPKFIVDECTGAVLSQYVDKLQNRFVVATEQNIRIRSPRS